MRALWLCHLFVQCLAWERLLKWKPVQISNTEATLGEDDEERLRQVFGAAWQVSTLETYGAGLLAFHEICDRQGIPEEQRCPATEAALLKFAAVLIGSYSKSLVGNYLAGV